MFNGKSTGEGDKNNITTPPFRKVEEKKREKEKNKYSLLV